MSPHSFFQPRGSSIYSPLPKTPSETPRFLSGNHAEIPSSGTSTPGSVTSERGVPTSTQCTFPIEWDKIRYDRKPLPSIRYRQPHKRALNTKTQSSMIYKHGAQLTTDGDNKFWLCKYCHISGRHDSALYSSESTTSIIYHLKHQHKLEEFGYKAAASNPFDLAKGLTGSMEYFGGRRLAFNDLQFKDEFVDWVIRLDLTFRQATNQYTRNIFASCLEDINKILPKSPSTLSA